jgi:glycerol-1-phosphate dehydrogenase [NAD(P)+]
LRDGGVRFTQIESCLRQHGLPRRPSDVGLTQEQFVRAVMEAPSTRPDRYTILEHLDLDEDAMRARVHAFVHTVS